MIELQASIVIGSGSASFEMIRALVERLPVMITPRWVNTAAQPIAIEDVIDYLAASARLPAEGNLTFEIGGADVTSYMGIMREYARQRKLRRWILRVPFLSLSLSSRWLTLITPVYAAIGRSLIASVRNPSVVLNQAALDAFDIRPMGITRAIERALANEDRSIAETRWSDARTPAAAVSALPEPGRYLLVNEQTTRVPVAPFRRSPRSAALEDAPAGTSAIAVEDSRPDRSDDGRRRHAARPARSRDSLPGKHFGFLACGILRARPAASIVCRNEGSRARLARVPRGARRRLHRDQAARANSNRAGLFGLLYWYLLTPVHEVMFRGMLRRIAAAALHAGEHVEPLKLTGTEAIR